jgi:hypothetical protein
MIAIFVVVSARGASLVAVARAGPGLFCTFFADFLALAVIFFAALAETRPLDFLCCVFLFFFMKAVVAQFRIEPP